MYYMMYKNHTHEKHKIFHRTRDTRENIVQTWHKNRRTDGSVGKWETKDQKSQRQHLYCSDPLSEIHNRVL